MRFMRLPLLLAGLFLSLAAHGEVLMTEKAALERAFPGARLERKTLFLTAEQSARIEQLAKSKLPSPIVTAFVARKDAALVGSAVLDTHTVRTMPETVLTALEPDGRLRMALVLQFGEPPDYLPRENWLHTLTGKSLDGELWPGRGVRRVTGATLTVDALTGAVRRALALGAILKPGAP
jgi:hypothetical protein